MAFKQARAEETMVVFDSVEKYGDFICGNGVSD
jgi:hypothetical protein